MLEIFFNALKDKEYYICIYDNNIYIYSYIDIISFNSSLIVVKLCNCNLVIKGNNMLINKMEKHELLISGNIIGVNYE